jgi:hypothetical protein
MVSLDTLSASGFELSTEQLNDVDGGLVWFFIAGLAVFDVVLWGHILTR